MEPNNYIQPFIYSVAEYRKAGWLGTIPLPPGKKSPPPDGFTGARGKYPDIKQIKDWCNLKSVEYVDTMQIGLRLGEVDTSKIDGLPAVYAGNIVAGWEVIGIDVDNYKDKNGYQQLLELQQKFGELPPTVKSSSRWASGITSYIALFLVPKGYRYIGKAAKCIEIIQKRHRYMVVWPSVNPDAEGAIYEWLDSDASIVRTPTLDMIPVLPETWWGFLSSNGQPDSEDPISDMTGGELLDWAREAWLDSDGEMCAGMTSALNKQINNVENTTASHPTLNDGHWNILRNGGEGHSGWVTALNLFNKAWGASAMRKRDGAVSPDEIRRSAIGALSKIQPIFTQLPDDPCACKKDVADGKYEERLSNFAMEEECGCGNPNCKGCDSGRMVASHDFDGFGPVVGRLLVIKERAADSYGMHDDGNGQHFVDLYGDNVKFVHARDNWAIWLPSDGTSESGRWYSDFDDRMVSLAYRRVRKRQESFARKCKLEAAKNPADNAQKQKARSWTTWARRSGDIGPIHNAIDSAKRLYIDDNTPVTLLGKEFDANPRLLGCANGVLELSSDPELRAPKREDYVTYNTGVPWVPWRALANGDDVNLEGYHLWQEYLNMFLPDLPTRHFVQKVLGHSIIGENPEKILIFLYGPHDSGKSTMIGAIAGALGDYYGTIDMNMFHNRNFNPQLVKSVPLRITGMSEVDAGVMDAATVKRLTGNDEIVSEIKYSSEIFKGRPQFTTVIACNNPPDIKNADEALRERILALPFNTTIDRRERKYERQTQIERYSGIAVFSWLVEGWRLYCEEGIKRDTWPRIVRIMHHEIISSLNSTQLFIDQMITKASDCDDGMIAHNRAMDNALKHNRRAPTAGDWPKEWTPSAPALYELYLRWCQANGIQYPLSHPDFSKELCIGKAQTRKVDGKTVRVYIGIRLNDSN